MVFAAASSSSPLPPSPSAAGLDAIPEYLIPKEEWYEGYLRWALYAGAVFQLVCILAVLLLPPNKGGDRQSDEVRNCMKE
jgi:hypothetical protein